MINYFLIISIMKIFINVQNSKIIELNNKINLFFAKFFSRNFSLGFNFSCIIFFLKIFKEKSNKSIFFDFKFSNNTKYFKKDLLYLNFMAKNVFKFFLSLMYSRLNIYQNFVEMNEPKKITKKINNNKKNFYSIRNMLISSSISFKNVNKTKKNIKKIFDFKGAFKNEQNVLNFPVFFTKLNIVLKKYKLKGFTKNAFELLANVLDINCKKLVLNLCKATIQEQKASYSKLEQWGRKNTVLKTKKNLNYNLKIEKNIINERSVQKQIACFRKVKKSLILKKKKLISSFKVIKKTKELNKKKPINNDYTENLRKTNKTLMSLLKGILQRRIRILKEATKCLNIYKPLLIKQISEKVNPIIIEKKNQIENFLEHTNQPIKLKEEVWCTSKDCLKLLNTSYFSNNDKIYFYKWFLYICNDYNSLENVQK
nr:hypothetical protein CcurKRNrm3_p004 [Cryptomonas curvata]